MAKRPPKNSQEGEHKPTFRLVGPRTHRMPGPVSPSRSGTVAAGRSTSEGGVGTNKNLVNLPKRYDAQAQGRRMEDPGWDR